MSDTANTARRERAVKWILNEDGYFSDEDLAWARNATCSMEDDTYLCSYLAGAREEAAIKDAEIERLKCEHAASRRSPRARGDAMSDDDHKSDCATHNDPYLPRGECDCGADTERKAAEEYANGIAEIAALHHRIGELEKQNDADRQGFSAEIAALNESITLQRVGIDALKRTNDKLNEENERLKDQRNAALRVIPMESLDEIRPVLYACAAGDISGGKALELLREWMETGSLDGFDGYAIPLEEQP